MRIELRHLSFLGLSLTVAASAACIDGHASYCSSEADCGPCQSCVDGVCMPDETLEGCSVEEDVLNALGVDTDVGQRTRSDGEPLDEAAHPLGSRRQALGKISELYGAGLVYRPGYRRRSFLLDDAAATAQDLLTGAPDETWTEAHRYLKHKAAVGADYDGDGRDEIAVAYVLVREEAGNQYIAEDIKLHLTEDGRQDFAESTAAPLSFVDDFGDAAGACDFWGTCLDLAAGDLDGDGDDELVLVSNYNDTLYVLDDRAGVFEVVAMHQLPAASQDTILMVDVADLDSDGRAEIAAAISDADRNDGVFLASYALYALGAAGLEELASDYLVNQDTQLEFLVNVKAADLDGDRLPEIVFGGRNESQGYTRLLLMEDSRGQASSGTVEPYAISDQALGVSGWFATLEAGDFDADGVDEIFAASVIVDLNDGQTTPLGIDAQTTRPQAVAVGDFDDAASDGKADLAVLWADFDATAGATSYVRLSTFGAPPAGGSQIVRRKDVVVFSGGYSEVIDYFFGGAADTALAAANVDDDTRIVEYTGDHATFFSDPQIIAVLASAPFHAGREHAEGYTVLGDSTTSGRETSHAVGANVGFSIGASVDSPLWGSAGSFEAKVTVSLAADFVWGGGSQVTYTSAVENPAGQDLVVFTAVPYDAYAYRVIESPNEEERGELFSLNIPRESRVYSVEREYYNAHNGEAPDIDAAVLQHTVGDPASYPSAAERDELMAGSSFALLSNQTHTCGGGGAVWSLACEWSEEHAAGFAVDVSIQSEIESVTGGLLLGISGGYHFGVETVWHWSNATFIEGAVGDLSPDDWEAGLAFDWGVFTYKTMLPGNGRPLVVVNYWVE